VLYLFAGIYEIFCGNKNFYVGKQPDPFPGTASTVSRSVKCLLLLTIIMILLSASFIHILFYQFGWIFIMLLVLHFISALS